MLKKEMDTLLGKRADAAEEDEEEGGGRVASRPDLFLQMREMGPFLKRDVEEAPDPRVPFTPDAWQRDLLDAIDARKSALVVAPTSAGKVREIEIIRLFSPFCMKKISPFFPYSPYTDGSVNPCVDHDFFVFFCGEIVREIDVRPCIVKFCLFPKRDCARLSESAALSIAMQ